MGGDLIGIVGIVTGLALFVFHELSLYRARKKRQPKLPTVPLETVHKRRRRRKVVRPQQISETSEG